MYSTKTHSTTAQNPAHWDLLFFNTGATGDFVLKYPIGGFQSGDIPFFGDLVLKYPIAGPLAATVLRGEGAVKKLKSGMSKNSLQTEGIAMTSNNMRSLSSSLASSSLIISICFF
jgi:hypothetical protein